MTAMSRVGKKLAVGAVGFATATLGTTGCESYSGQQNRLTGEASNSADRLGELRNETLDARATFGRNSGEALAASKKEELARREHDADRAARDENLRHPFARPR